MPIWLLLVLIGSALVALNMVLATRRTSRRTNYGIDISGGQITGGVTQTSNVAVGQRADGAAPTSDSNTGGGSSKTVLIIGLVTALVGLAEKMTGFLEKLLLPS